MPAGLTNILIEKGSDFVREFTIREKVTKNPVNIDGCNIVLKVSAKQGSEQLLQIPVVITSVINGTFEAVYPKTNVDTITINEGWFVINITWSDATTERLVEGRLVVSKGVI